MSRTYALAAVLLGLIGFAAIEVAGQSVGVRTALGPSLALDAAAYALATLLLAVLFATPFRRSRGWRALLAGLAFILLFAPLTAVLAGAIDLTLGGWWGEASMVRGAFIAMPLNLIVTFTLDLAYVALPLGIVSVIVLQRIARRGSVPRG